MLLSMTGFGEARGQDDRAAVHVELRSVNNRHLKLTCKLADRFAPFEPELERIVRDSVRRGTVQLVVRVDTPASADAFRINQVVLESYRSQLEASLGKRAKRPAFQAALLALPGVVESNRLGNGDEAADLWPNVEAATRAALTAFNESRAREGRHMADELLSLASTVAEHVETVAALGPGVVAAYADRLLERVQTFVNDRGVGLQASDLVREVAIFAERGDIAEEITRLQAHLDQFREVVASSAEEAAGRKLEFIVQEMGREANTMGSKAPDVAISRAVFEIKGALERIRELIQNIE